MGSSGGLCVVNNQGFTGSSVRFDGPFQPLTDAERNVSRDRFLEGMPPGDPWVFTYGSLMWDRDVFPHKDTASALLHGYHRRFCIWTILARGTPDLPGLALGLEPGGSCRGIAFRIARREAKKAFDEVWRREMYTACYEPRWTIARLENRTVNAVAFVARPDHVQYAGGLEPERMAFHVAHAHGRRGSCRDYLAETLNNLNVLGVRDRRLERLLQLVDAENT